MAFVCSSVPEDEKSLLTLAGKLKKNNVSVDFVVFGDLDDETQQKLTKFNDKVKGSEGSHMVVIPPSGSLLSDQLKKTPLLAREGGSGGGGDGGAGGFGGDVGGGGGGGGGGEFDEFGFDPSTDPELALALRMSMEEENARQQKRQREEAEAAAKTASLESVKEEDESAEPLLNKAGEPSKKGGKDEEEDDDDDDDDTEDDEPKKENKDDKMDTS